MNAKTLLKICRECGHGIYGTKPPSPAYGESVARLLAGTAATESHLIARRQHGFGLDSLGGAWGLWQTEGAPMIDNIKYLRARPDVLKRASDFVFMGEGELRAMLGMGNHGLMRAIHDSDRLACMFARVHYLRFPDPVPSDLDGQAAYYKRHYNTYMGKGSMSKYITDWRRLVEPAL